MAALCLRPSSSGDVSLLDKLLGHCVFRAAAFRNEAVVFVFNTKRRKNPSWRSSALLVNVSVVTRCLNEEENKARLCREGRIEEEGSLFALLLWRPHWWGCSNSRSESIGGSPDVGHAHPDNLLSSSGKTWRDRSPPPPPPPPKQDVSMRGWMVLVQRMLVHMGLEAPP